MSKLQGLSVPLVFILSLFVLYRLFRDKQGKRAPYPPGPTPKPIIGNALDIPLKKPWKKYKEWEKKFNSDIIHLSVLNTHVVVLNTMEDIVELLDRRSANYSDRPSLKLFKLLDSGGVITGLLPYGPTLKKHRKLMEEALKKDILPSYHHIFTGKVVLFLDQLLHKPDLFRAHIGQLGASITMAIVFGYDVTPGVKDKFVEPAEFAINTTAELAIPGRTLLVPFEFLCYIPSWIPGASTQRLCSDIKEAIRLTREGPYQYVKHKMDAGTSKDCVLARVLERDSGDPGYVEDKELLKDILASTGGVETMKVSMANFMLAMTLHTHAQKKAQEEIDNVVGSHRLPSYEDRTSLPYVEALYREVHRWRPVVPNGVPHTTVRDDVYKGYYIPKGTFILPNVWASTRNEDKYPEPDSFNPERFLSLDGTLNDDTVSYVFGFGRRTCPGKSMADKVVWLMIVSVLATFNISKARDGETGNEIDVDPDAYTSGATSHPLPFKCSIVRRSEQAESLIQNAAAVAWRDLEK